MAENYITTGGKTGNISISEDVIATIAREAALDVEGVAGFANASGGEIAELIGVKSVSKGMRITFDDGAAVVDAIVMVEYGRSIKAVASKTQEAVLSALQSMTGMEKIKVNVHVAGVAFEKK